MRAITISTRAPWCEDNREKECIIEDASVSRLAFISCLRKRQRFRFILNLKPCKSFSTIHATLLLRQFRRRKERKKDCPYRCSVAAPMGTVPKAIAALHFFLPRPGFRTTRRRNFRWQNKKKKIVLVESMLQNLYNRVEFQGDSFQARDTYLCF